MVHSDSKNSNFDILTLNSTESKPICLVIDDLSK